MSVNNTYHIASQVLVMIFFVASGFGAQEASLPPEVIRYADMVLYNGKVLTVDDNFTIGEAVAIRDGKFLAVGTSAYILSMAGPATKRIDLAGKSVVPGFFNNHAHGTWMADIAKAGRFPGGIVEWARGKDQALADLKEIADRAKPGEWVVIRGERTNTFYAMTRRDLDPIFPKNPFYIVNSTQEVLANTVVLELAGLLDSDMNGIIKDPETGEPTGQLWGFAAGLVTYEIVPQPPVTEAALEHQKTSFKAANALGLTTVAGRAQGIMITILNELWQRGELTIRARVASEMIRQNPNLEGYLKRVGNLSGFGNEWVKILGGTVQEVDGAQSGGSLLTYMPKLREHPEDPFPQGVNKWVGYGPIVVSPPRETTEWYSVILANRYGWTLTSSHTMGDLASDIFLGAYAEADKERSLQGRGFAYDHGLIRTRGNLELAKKLDVIHSIQPSYVFTGQPDHLIYRHGADAVQQMTPVRTLIDMGLKVAAEGDRPLWQMEKLVTRTDDRGNVWGADEAISREESLRMHTSWAARYTRDEKITGTIEAGKLADLVVLGGDYMTCPEDEISKLPVLLTVVGGRIVYDRDQDGDVSRPTTSVFFPGADLRTGGGRWEEGQIPEMR